MKLYPLLSHNIEIVKFLGPITTNPMKQNEQEKSLNTNQRHSAVQCNAMHMLWYNRLSHYTPIHPKKYITKWMKWRSADFSTKKSFPILWETFSSPFIVVRFCFRYQKFDIDFFYIWMKCIQFSTIILCMRKKICSNEFQKKIFFHSKSW